jgi:hypothetical protein
LLSRNGMNSVLRVMEAETTMRIERPEYLPTC